MALTRQEKEDILTGLQGDLGSAQSVTFIAFDKLSVADTQDMRRKLADAGVRYQVVKKTLLGKALQSVTVSGTMPDLNGNIAIAWSDDQLASAREVYEFRKGHEEQLRLLGGIFENRFMNESEITEIATIPSLHTLRGMFVNIINSPIQGLVIALDQIAEQKG